VEEDDLELKHSKMVRLRLWRVAMEGVEGQLVVERFQLVPVERQQQEVQPGEDFHLRE
jgi:hypothetical protein